MTVDSNSRQRAESRDREYIISVLSAQICKDSRRKVLFDQNDLRARSRSDDDTNIIRCICANIHLRIQEAVKTAYKPPDKYHILCEDTSYEDYCNPQSYSVETIKYMFMIIQSRSQMEYECMILTLIYIERLSATTGGVLCICPENWRSTLIGCMMLASKMWDDISMINDDFASFFSDIPLQRLNKIEYLLLTALDFGLCVSVEAYNKMHDTIRDLDTTAQIISKSSSLADSFDCSQFEADNSDSDYILLLKREPDTLSVGQPEDDVKTRDEDSDYAHSSVNSVSAARDVVSSSPLVLEKEEKSPYIKKKPKSDIYDFNQHPFAVSSARGLKQPSPLTRNILWRVRNVLRKFSRNKRKLYRIHVGAAGIQQFSP